MSDKGTVILKQLKETLPKLNDEEKQRLLGFTEGLAYRVNTDQQEKKEGKE